MAWSQLLVTSIALPLVSGCGTTPAPQPSSDGPPPYRYARHYTPGEAFGYRMETRHSTNGALDSVRVAVSRHEVQPGAVPAERVRWEQLEITRGDAVESLPERAAAVAAYDISLAPGGSLALPPLTEPLMVGPIADLNTFYVAVSGSVGSDRLKAVGDSYTTPEAVVGVWTAPPTTPKGEDCIVPRVELAALDAAEATFRTVFAPPDAPCLEPLGAFATASVHGEHPNNFHQVMTAADRTLTAMWGLEAFTTDCRVARASGRIIACAMDNTLTLRVRVGCDETLESCAAEVPTTIHRSVTIQLIPAPDPSG